MGRKMKKAFKRFLRAARFGEIEILRECVKISGFEIDDTDKYGKRALMYACENNRGEIATELLKLGADPNLPDKEGWTPLIKATQCGYLPIVKLLVENKADVNQVTTSVGRFALRQAASNGWLLCMDYLVKNGADINIVDYLNCTALCSPAYQGHVEVVECLLKAAANPNAKLLDGSTPLYIATQEGHLSVVKLLIAAGANIEVRNTSGCTPLMVACGYNRLSIVKFICEAGCDINAVTYEGETALHWAALKGHSEVVDYLLQQGAVIIENQKGKNPMYFAKKGNHTKVMNLLKNAENAKRSKSATSESSETRSDVKTTNALPNKTKSLELSGIENGVNSIAKPSKTTNSEKLRKFGVKFFGKKSKATTSELPKTESEAKFVSKPTEETTSELPKIESDVISGAMPREAKTSAVHRITPAGAFFTSVKQDLNGIKDHAWQLKDLVISGVTKAKNEGIMHGVFTVLDGWHPISNSHTAAKGDSANLKYTVNPTNSDNIKDSATPVNSAFPTESVNISDSAAKSENSANSADSTDDTDSVSSANSADSANLLDLSNQVNSVSPLDSIKDVKSNISVDSVKLKDSDTPVHSAYPVDTTIPMDSTNPTESANTAQSDNSVDSADPVDLANPIHLQDNRDFLEKIRNIQVKTIVVTNEVGVEKQEKDVEEQTLLDVKNQLKNSNVKIILELMDIPQDKVNKLNFEFLNRDSKCDNWRINADLKFDADLMAALTGKDEQ